MSNRGKDNLEVWTFDYDPKTGSPYPIQTECPVDKFGWPHQDTDGRQMFENTHFLQEAKAWRGLLDNAQAHQNQCTSDLRNAQSYLKAATERLAEVAAFNSEVIEAHRKATSR